MTARPKGGINPHERLPTRVDPPTNHENRLCHNEHRCHSEERSDEESEILRLWLRMTQCSILLSEQVQGSSLSEAGGEGSIASLEKSAKASAARFLLRHLSAVIIASI